MTFPFVNAPSYAYYINIHEIFTKGIDIIGNKKGVANFIFGYVFSNGGLWNHYSGYAFLC